MSKKMTAFYGSIALALSTMPALSHADLMDNGLQVKRFITSDNQNQIKQINYTGLQKSIQQAATGTVTTPSQQYSLAQLPQAQSITQPIRNVNYVQLTREREHYQQNFMQVNNNRTVQLQATGAVPVSYQAETSQNQNNVQKVATQPRRLKLKLPPHRSVPIQTQTEAQYYSQIENIVHSNILHTPNGKFTRHVKTGFIRPVNYRINSKYGMRFHPKLKRVMMHTGVDFAAPKGTPIRAVADGVVTMSRYNGAYGKMVLLDHFDGKGKGDFHSLYGHASKLAVRVGQRVKQGDIIAYVGSTGRSTGNHLHFELFHNGKRLNPSNLIPSKQTV